MPIEVVTAKYLKDYLLEIEFNDGTIKEVNLQPELTGPVFKPLKDLEYFKKFSIQFNTIGWPNGADFAPEFLFEIGKEIDKKRVA